jgi:hypothetical protein
MWSQSWSSTHILTLTNGLAYLTKASLTKVHCFITEVPPMQKLPYLFDTFLWRQKKNNIKKVFLFVRFNFAAKSKNKGGIPKSMVAKL